MKAAAIQMASSASVSENLAQASALLAEAAAAGAQLAVLPENFALMPRVDGDRAAAVELDGRGPIQEFLAAQARTHRMTIVGGTLALKAAAGHKLRSACLVYAPTGLRLARYDKMHLFDVTLANGEQYRESNAFEPGDTAALVDTPLGVLGLAVCYDVRFPELFRRLVSQGAELFALPSAFTQTTGEAHWEVLVRARAIENLAYIVAAGQGGLHANGRRTYGDSMIVDPWGVVLARRAQGPGVVLADIDRARQQALRAQLPALDHRRAGF